MTHTSETSSPVFLAALRHLLRPLVRLLVSRGVTYPMLSELLKQSYVEVTNKQFRLDGRTPTDSRISLLSGIHRKDIRRLREAAPSEAEAMPESVALGAQLVAAWTTNRDFLDTKGRPRRLPRLASQGGVHSFESLVASVSKDIRARSVLDEWLRLGVVEQDGEDRIALRTGAFVPRHGFDEKAFYLGHNVHDHIAAASHNLLDEDQPFLERCVHYDGIVASSIAELASLAENSGMRALQMVNRKAMAREARDGKNTDPKHRMTFGIYFYSAPLSDELPAAKVKKS